MSDLEVTCDLDLGLFSAALTHHNDITAPYRTAMRMWLTGDRQGAHDLIAATRHILPTYKYLDQVTEYYLVPALMSASEGDLPAARAQAAAALEPTAHANGTTFWHIVNYALDQEDDAAFMAQGWLKDIRIRLKLAQALRADLHGDPGTAAAYAAWLAVDHGLDCHDLMRDIGHWRIAAQPH
jgi:hypothetical protein